MAGWVANETKYILHTLWVHIERITTSYKYMCARLVGRSVGRSNERTNERNVCECGRCVFLFDECVLCIFRWAAASMKSKTSKRNIVSPCDDHKDCCLIADQMRLFECNFPYLVHYKLNTPFSLLSFSLVRTPFFLSHIPSNI